MINFHRLRAPTNLRVTDRVANRVLLVGSCVSLLLDGLLRDEHGLSTKTIHIHAMCDFDPTHYKDGFDFQVVAIPVDSILPRHIAFFADFNDEAAAHARFEQSVVEMLRLLDQAMQINTAFGLTSFVCNLFVPQQNHQGRLLPRYSLLNPVFYFEELNRILYDEVVKRPNSYVVDVDQIAATFGKAQIQDDSIWALTHGGVLTNLDWELYEEIRKQGHERIEPLPPLRQGMEACPEIFWRALCEEVLVSFRTIKQVDQVKVIVVDLDDTIWRSVIAEGVVEDPHLLFEGIPYGLIEALLLAKSRGIALAIASKNSPEVVKAFWDKRVRWHLDFDAFVVKKINWHRKSQNIREIAQLLNVGLDSVVFVDDNPREREEVKRSIPEVRVLGSDFYQLRRDILWSPETQVARITAESRSKTEMLKAQVARDTARAGASSAEFLDSLNLTLEVDILRTKVGPKFARAVELINKTNQFNTTGVRWSAEEISGVIDRAGYVLSVGAQDRYTDYGIIGIALVEGAFVHIFVMSCRVIGMEVENAIFRSIESFARRSGVKRLECVFTPTGRNGLALDFLRRSGWTGQDEKWSTNLEDPPIPVPSHIRLVETVVK